MTHTPFHSRLVQKTRRSISYMEKQYKRLLSWVMKTFPIMKRPRVRLGVLIGVCIIIAAEIATIMQPLFIQDSYALGQSKSLLPEVNQTIASAIAYDKQENSFSFNPQKAAGESIKPNSQMISATAFVNAKKGISVTDPTNNINFSMTPKFKLADGKQQDNHIVYPLLGNNGWAVYTIQATGVKEDIVLTSSSSDSQTFEYKLGLGDGLEARQEADGSISVYGNTTLSANITTGSDADAALLEKARKSAAKDTYLFSIPKPFVVEKDKKQSMVNSRYVLAGNDLKVVVSGLKKATYPLSIDPSIYVVTAQQFMQGNNESNINFNVDDKLIEKAHTTGARFNSWDPTLNLNTSTWKQGAVAGGGYIYTAGGVHPNGGIVNYTTAGSDTFVVPTGITSITVKTWGGGGGGGGGGNSQAGGAGGGGGYTVSTIAVTPGETLTVYVGGGGSGGAFSSGGNDAGGGGGGGGYTSIYRSSTALAVTAGGGGGGGGRQARAGGDGGAGGGTTGIAGTNGFTSNNGGGGAAGTPTSGGAAGAVIAGANQGTAGALLTGGLGGDGRNGAGADGSGASGGLGGGGDGGVANVSTTRAGGGGGGSGYYGGGGGTATTSSTTASGGGGGGGSSYTVAGSTGVTNTAGSGTSPGNAGDADRSGAADGGSGGAALGNGADGNNGIAVITYTGTVDALDTVSWAKLNTTTGAIESTNPGNGVCSGWCTSTAYKLPGARGAFSMVLYNGFLYVIGGEDSNCTTGNGTGADGVCKTVFISKIGANGEPQLWHPTDANKANWVYWYRDTDLTTPRSFTSAVAYNNRMYLLGGKTSSGGTPSIVNSVQVADLIPTGTLGAWATSGASLPYNVYGHGVQAYNDRLYIVGGASTIGGTPLSSVYYSKLNSTGALNSWVQTTGFTTPRMSYGGNFTAIWGGYLYLNGGCSAVNGSGYCTAVENTTQLASINADGSLDTWNYNDTSLDTRMGHSLLTWRNYIYNIGGCTSQNSSTGICANSLNTINKGAINRDGDASTVGSTVASGTAPCSGGSPYNCNLPASTGNVLNATAIVNGYLYVMGGCTNNACTTVSTTITYQAIASDGTLQRPATCSGSYTDSYCISSVSLPNGLAASGSTVFNGRIYLVGGFNTGTNIYYVSTNSDGSLGAWSSVSLNSIGAPSTLAYAYAYSRANPAAAGSVPGNLYIIGGCTAASVGCSGYSSAVNKCNIDTAGVPSACSTTGQLQIQNIVNGVNCGTGLGAMVGSVYAGYVYLIGGLTPNCVDLTTARYAKIDNNNNIVTVGTGWVEGANQMNTGRRRGAGFGYNGYIYVVGGYDGTTGVLADIEFAKINVSDGSWESWTKSAVTINQRWGLSVPISNSYAYVIGGCVAGAAPSSCTSRTTTTQTFQVYNNDSGAPAAYSPAANTYGTSPNRIGVSSTILNGYLYVAGGCTGNLDCNSAVTNVSYAPIDVYGNLGSWSNASGSLPAARAWGKLLAAGGSLYYVGGQDTNGASQSTIYYGTPSSGNVSSWATASNSLPATRTQFGAAVWNNRLYVVGGATGNAGTTMYSANGSGTFVVPTGISSITVKAWGAGGGGGNASGSSGRGGDGGGGGFSQATLSVTAGESLTYNVGTGGGSTSTANNAGNGGGFSALLRSATYLVQAGGGAGGGGSTGTANGGNGGAGGGTSGVVGTAGSGTATVGGAGSFGTTVAGGAGGTAGTGGVAGNSGNANNGGDGGGSLTNCTTAVTGRGGNGGTGAGGKGGASTTCSSGGGGGGGRFGGGGGGSGSSAAVRGGGGGGGGSSLVTGSGTVQTAGSGQTPGNSGDPTWNGAGNGGNGSTGTGSTNGSDGALVITWGSNTVNSTIYVSPAQTAGGNITSAWSTSSTSFNVARSGLVAVAYANNLYVLGGYDGSNYLSDTQFSKIDGTTGNAGSWAYSKSLPGPLAGGDGFAANGYVYILGGRSDDTTCSPLTLVAPISANTTIVSGNNPTGVGEWFQTNQAFTGSRYGNAAAYNDGKAYVIGGGCGTPLSYPGTATQQTALLSQPQVARYSILMDTDSDVFPTNWLLNGVDNSIGARWQLNYRSMTNTTTLCKSPPMTTWGVDTAFGNVTLGLPGVYTPKDGSGVSTNCARFYYFSVGVDSSQAYGYPDDVGRGPTITDLTLQFTADPSKRLLHGRTFTGGLQQPDDTPYYTN